LTLAAGRRAPRLGSRGLARSAERRAPPRSATPRPAAGRPQPGPKSEPADSVVPYPLRVLTVGTAIGMATPFYCIVAVPVAAWRLRMVKPELAMLLGVTASAVLLLCKDYIAPWLLANGNTILPLSLANGLAGGLTYVAQPAELATGRPRARVANLPPFDLLSSLITYLTAPHILATARYPCTPLHAPPPQLCRRRRRAGHRSPGSQPLRRARHRPRHSPPGSLPAPRNRGRVRRHGGHRGRCPCTRSATRARVVLCARGRVCAVLCARSGQPL
jgi:hypothetical protein